jgi:hypothetical protein
MNSHSIVCANFRCRTVALIVNPALNLNNPTSNTHAAGTTFMGQFLDHDMTFDSTSRLGVPARPELSPNLRDPAFDLDSVYGGGPIADAELYEPARMDGMPQSLKSKPADYSRTCHVQGTER